MSTHTPPTCPPTPHYICISCVPLYDAPCMMLLCMAGLPPRVTASRDPSGSLAQRCRPRCARRRWGRWSTPRGNAPLPSSPPNSPPPPLPPLLPRTRARRHHHHRRRGGREGRGVKVRRPPYRAMCGWRRRYRWNTEQRYKSSLASQGLWRFVQRPQVWRKRRRKQCQRE